MSIKVSSPFDEIFLTCSLNVLLNESVYSVGFVKITSSIVILCKFSDSEYAKDVVWVIPSIVIFISFILFFSSYIYSIVSVFWSFWMTSFVKFPIKS